MFKKIFVLSALAALSSTAFGGGAELEEEVVQRCHNSVEKMSKDSNDGITVIPQAITSVCVDDSKNNQIRQIYTPNVTIISPVAQTVRVVHNVDMNARDCQAKTDAGIGLVAKVRVKKGKNLDLDLSARGTSIRDRSYRYVCYTPFKEEK